VGALNLVYWKEGYFLLGKLLVHPEIMTQGESLEELEDNIRDACRLMVLQGFSCEYEGC